jgi:hypothetical protein
MMTNDRRPPGRDSLDTAARITFVLAKTLLVLCAVAVVCVAGATALGRGEAASSTAAGVPSAATKTRAASIPLGARRQHVLSLPRLGRFSGRCADGAALGLSYRNTSATSESVGVNAGPSALAANLDPTERVSVNPLSAGVQTWQLAVISKGRIEVATVTASVTRLGPATCFASIRAEQVRRPR